MTIKTPTATGSVNSDALDASFQSHREATAEDRWMAVGDQVVRLRFASERMLALMEAFGHLELEALATPDLTVCLWDSPDGLQPPVPAPADPAAPRGTRMVWNDGQLRGCYQPGQDTLSVLEPGAARAWFWAADGSSMPYWEYAAPLRLLLSWWLPSRGSALVHGAAVGRPDGGALIVGRGGSGKSTTSLLSLLGGLSFASDDYVVVERDWRGHGPFVHSAFGSGKLDNSQCERFPALWPAIVNPSRLPEEKAVFMVNRFAPALMARSFPLRLVLVPRITGQRDTEVLAGSPMAALAALAPSTIFQLPGDPAVELKAMATLVQAVPVRVLALGTDFTQIPTAIDRALEQLSSSVVGAGA